VAVQADSADAAAVQASVEKTVAELGGLDILVNNAGILRLGELKDISLADIDALLNVNVRAQIIASKAALAHLTKGGRIITIGSYFADRVPTPILGVCAATKSALAAFTKALARELGPKEITANLVQPGSIDTDMNPAHGPSADTGEREGSVHHRLDANRRRRRERLDALRFTGFMSQSKGDRYVDP
jgi:NAD(P)-dependent dehydrogenase (short-subunit alcohol dehydrogenase family)